MHMESYPQLIPLVILIPALGAFFNLVWGARLTERVSGWIGIIASGLAFVVSMLIFSALSASHGAGVVVDPPLLDGWIRIESIGLDIPWQFRVDTLTAVMLLVVTGVGTLIHIYSMGYMHGDPKFSRFFAFLNLFLMFMLVLVTANNYLMMFVGWEGVGLASYLLIGFWWDKSAPTGWKNSNAARKAMIVNRIGDFGILMSIFLMFWTFGTLNYYAAGESANVAYALEVEGYISAEQAELGEIFAEYEGGSAYGEEGAVAEGEHSEASATEGEGAYGEEGGHSGEAVARDMIDNTRFEPSQLGVFGQTEYFMSLDPDDPQRQIDFGSFTLDFGTVLFLIVLFMLLGVSGKSAQIPLFVWLPDAMAGPTPVSALMHAATMVTAGVFLLVRSSVFLDHAPEARFIISVIGGLTAVSAGFMAMGQWDIKRVLAYSTISQLGFMVAAIGIGAYVAAMFHLVTHAVFKALLFLGSGSIIHGVEHGHHHVHDHGHGHDDHGDHSGDHHEEEFDPQDMRNMGGLRSRMPITFITYLIGTFALAGLPIFAGFWSKDEILLDAWHVGLNKGLLEGYIVFGLLLLAAGFTAFYMWRQIQMVFFGKARSEAADHAPESVWWMTLPLIVLAIGSAFIGLINVPYGAWPFSEFYKAYEFKHWLETSIPSVTQTEALYFNYLIAALATGLAFGAIFLAHSIYGGSKAVRDNKDPLELSPSTRQIWTLANMRLYWDQIYFIIFENPFNRTAQFLYEVLDWRFLHDYFHDSVIKRGYDAVASLLAKVLDVGVIDGIVNGVAWVIGLFSGRLRTVQTGYVRTYAVALLLGVVAVVVVMLLPLIQTGS